MGVGWRRPNLERRCGLAQIGEDEDVDVDESELEEVEP